MDRVLLHSVCVCVMMYAKTLDHMESLYILGDQLYNGRYHIVMKGL